MAPPNRKTAALFLPLRGAGARKRQAVLPKNNPALQAIWDVVCTIPRGKVSTYGTVARAAGLPGRARLTGFALRMAPEELHLPWHRVLGAGGRIVFAASTSHYREQAKRLRADGVPVKNGRVDRTFLVDVDPL